MKFYVEAIKDNQKETFEFEYEHANPICVYIEALARGVFIYGPIFKELDHLTVYRNCTIADSNGNEVPYWCIVVDENDYEDLIKEFTNELTQN